MWYSCCSVMDSDLWYYRGGSGWWSINQIHSSIALEKERIVLGLSGSLWHQEISLGSVLCYCTSLLKHPLTWLVSQFVHLSDISCSSTVNFFWMGTWTLFEVLVLLLFTSWCSAVSYMASPVSYMDVLPCGEEGRKKSFCCGQVCSEPNFLCIQNELVGLLMFMFWNKTGKKGWS